MRNVYAKAILAALIALCGALAVAAQDNGISLTEWFTSIGAALVAGGGVYQVGPPVQRPSLNAERTGPANGTIPAARGE